MKTEIAEVREAAGPQIHLWQREKLRNQPEKLGITTDRHERRRTPIREEYRA